MVHIFHHIDADGFAAAAVIGSVYLNTSQTGYTKEIAYYPVNYDMTMDFSPVKPGDEIFIVDYSISRESDQKEIIRIAQNVTDNIHWIDHHKTSDEVLKKHPIFEKIAKNGLVDTSNKYAGCLLAYIWTCTEVITEKAKKQYATEAPLWLKYVSDHDVWAKTIPESDAFSKGVTVSGLYKNFLDLENPDSYIRFVDIYPFNINDINQRHISLGELVLELDSTRNERLVKNNGFETFLEILKDGKSSTYKIICFNGYGNSMVLGDRIYEYDAVCIFNTKDGIEFTYSMYSDKEKGMDCSIVASFFKDYFGITGGGHAHACGWTAPQLTFIKDNTSHIDVDSNQFIIVPADILGKYQLIKT